MSEHPVLKSGLSQEHVDAFEKILDRSYDDDIHPQIIDDLVDNYLVERNGNELTIPLIVIFKWASYKNCDKFEYPKEE